MQTYVAEISGRPIFAFRSTDDLCAQAWLDINVSMRRRLETALSNGKCIWDGQAAILARKATSAESKAWSNSNDRVAETEEPDTITVWLIPAPAEVIAPQNKKAAPKGGLRSL